ncbi:MAG: AMP-binding protein, partial [Pseudomonadota bacterium]
MSSYRAIYEGWKADPERFWMDAAEAVDWDTKPSKALEDADAPLYRWFGDGRCNTCHNALDRHVAAGRGDQPALIYDSPITGAKAIFTYAEMLDRVSRLAGALAAHGVGVGDRVVIYMPMVPEAVMAMLACARIGAIHSVVFGGFAANELAVRLDDSQPKAILAASCGIEPGRVVPYKPLLDNAIELAEHKPGLCIVLQREQSRASMVEGRDVDWQEAVAAAEPVPCVSLPGDAPLYILYTSGTTGQPKGVVRPTGGHLVSLNWTMKAIYDIGPGEVMFTASDVGWVVGHSYICYAPLLAGATTIVFEGKPVGTPNAGTFWRIISEYGVKSFFTAPTAFRAIKREDPTGEFIARYPMPGLKALYLAGERADPATVE